MKDESTVNSHRTDNPTDVENKDLKLVRGYVDQYTLRRYTMGVSGLWFRVVKPILFRSVLVVYGTLFNRHRRKRSLLKVVVC